MNRRLLERRRRLLERLPRLDEVLRGSLVERTVRCGSASCHCADGDGHPNVFLSVTVAGGRTEQLSVPPELIGQVRRGLAVYTKCWSILEEISTINRRLLHEQRELQRQQGKRRRRG